MKSNNVCPVCKLGKINNESYNRETKFYCQFKDYSFTVDENTNEIIEYHCSLLHNGELNKIHSSIKSGYTIAFTPSYRCDFCSGCENCKFKFTTGAFMSVDKDNIYDSIKTNFDKACKLASFL
jgi:hypothetical protein